MFSSLDTARMQKNTAFTDKVQAYPCAQPFPWANLMYLTAPGVVVNSYATASMTKQPREC